MNSTRERPILFSGAMVRAILAGTKTQTRRVVKPAKLVHHFRDGGAFYLDGAPVPCPYGAPGDRLWVRETWREGNSGTERDSVFYRADEPDHDGAGWKPSIHMPRWASRIDLEIASVRVERLQDITEDDARAEGVFPIPRPPRSGGHSHRASFDVLWDEINGDRTPWASNPWVWVVSFKRVKP